jgi:hypothetical protein
MLMHIFPYLVVTPTGKAFVDAVPVTVLFGKQAPLGSAAQHPQDGFNELSAFSFIASTGSGVVLQEWVDLFPLIVTQFGICHAPILP